MSFVPAEIIKKKRNRSPLSQEEIQFFINGYTKGEIPDYQMSALLMAIYFNGMDEAETLHLTQTMLHSGITVDLSEIPSKKVDKHSTGGVGDKTSLILGPIVAAAGVPVPMISGRGLGHTGGTLDKLESIPGFNTQLSLDEFRRHVKNSLICFIGQTKDICPADKKIYALRDVTATVESLPLICASIMSKKLAEGIDALVLDVKYGSGAFMKTKTDAEALARALKGIGEGAGKKVVALLTDMNQPLGAYAGNALEVKECIEIMQNKTRTSASGRDLYEDTRELSLQLSGYMIHLGGKANSPQEGYTLARKMLESGAALKKFEELCKIQGGNLDQLPEPKYFLDVKAQSSGFISGFDAEAIGVGGIKIKMGRAKVSDIIDPVTGFEFFKKIGDPVNTGEPVLRIWGASQQSINSIAPEILNSFSVSKEKPKHEPLIGKIL